MKYRIMYVHTYSGSDYCVAQYKRWWWPFWNNIDKSDSRILSRDEAISRIYIHNGNKKKVEYFNVEI